MFLILCYLREKGIPGIPVTFELLMQSSTYDTISQSFEEFIVDNKKKFCEFYDSIENEELANDDK